ncbi:MAG TPA: hypothetical protein ENK88_07535 [Campylobacterales bacterium]|nr:hypothetical protein [Campylobacterales bacterium]HHC11446.1 hypothetical protein [Campylobacterales bacterium]
MKLEGEPTLNQIDDYNNNESKEKRNIVRWVVIGLIIISAIYSIVKYRYSTVDDYIGTPENPGINTAKR